MKTAAITVCILFSLFAFFICVLFFWSLFDRIGHDINQIAIHAYAFSLAILCSFFGSFILLKVYDVEKKHTEESEKLEKIQQQLAQLLDKKKQNDE